MFLSPLWDDSDGSKPIWQIYAIANDQGCPVEESLEQWLNDASLRKHATGMLDLIVKIGQCQQGPVMFAANCHEAVAGEGIYRLRKGELRLYFFYGNNQKVIVCPHGEIKRTDKVSKTVRQLLIEARNNYLEAHRTKALKIKKT
jgi:mRNA-degrading endonuclease RelE of RelBE toxin-antitoxin system